MPQTNEKSACQTQAQLCQSSIVSELEESKIFEVAVFPVPADFAITDYMVIASGFNSRHNRAASVHLQKKMTELKFSLIGLEGQRQGEWILLDFGYAVVHLMTPDFRKFYDLDSLWDPKLLEGAVGHVDRD